MARDRRSPGERQFDLAKHGWAFCNRPMLEEKIRYLTAHPWAETEKGKADIQHLLNVLSRMI